jgi:putative peptidoglycan lipid II flippase
LLRGLRKRSIYQPQPGWGEFVLKLALAVYVMGTMLWVMTGDSASWLTAGALERIARLSLLVVSGAAVYFGTLWLTGFRLRDFNRRGSE